jgi:hypothetical protein
MRRSRLPSDRLTNMVRIAINLAAVEDATTWGRKVQHSEDNKRGHAHAADVR